MGSGTRIWYPQYCSSPYLIGWFVGILPFLYISSKWNIQLIRWTSTLPEYEFFVTRNSLGRVVCKILAMLFRPQYGEWKNVFLDEAIAIPERSPRYLLNIDLTPTRMGPRRQQVMGNQTSTWCGYPSKPPQKCVRYCSSGNKGPSPRIGIRIIKIRRL